MVLPPTQTAVQISLYLCGEMRIKRADKYYWGNSLDYGIPWCSYTWVHVGTQSPCVRWKCLWCRICMIREPKLGVNLFYLPAPHHHPLHPLLWGYQATCALFPVGADLGCLRCFPSTVLFKTQLWLSVKTPRFNTQLDEFLTCMTEFLGHNIRPVEFSFPLECLQWRR